MSWLGLIPLSLPLCTTGGSTSALPAIASAPTLTWSLPSLVPTLWHGPVSTVTSPQISWSGTVPLVPPLSLLQTVASDLLRLSLSPDCRPIPAKLVEKSRAGQFVKLPDNVKLVDKLESAQAAGFPSVYANPMHQPRLREVRTPVSWIHCFLAHVAVQTDDSRTRDMLTYARLVLGEAMAHGEIGWLEYDRAACQQRGLDPAKPWIVLNTGLHSRLILGCSASGTVHQCIYCQGSDHTLAQLQCVWLFSNHPGLYPVRKGVVVAHRQAIGSGVSQIARSLSHMSAYHGIEERAVFQVIVSIVMFAVLVEVVTRPKATVDATESPRIGRQSCTCNFQVAQLSYHVLFLSQCEPHSKHACTHYYALLFNSLC